MTEPLSSTSQSLVRRVGDGRVPTEFGEFHAIAFSSLKTGIEHAAFVMGDPSQVDDVLVRVHSECLTGDIFGSQRCDCGPQLKLAIRLIAEEGVGAIIYLRGHEGRGMGLGHKLRAYTLQDAGRDTVDANVELGFPVDSRDYAEGAHILQALGVSSLRLMTNNPAKVDGLVEHGLVAKREPLEIEPNDENLAYLTTKRDRMGHLLDDVDE